MKYNGTVFEFKCYWENDKEREIVNRYVVAQTEEEAIEKMQQYVDDLRKIGCDNLIFFDGPIVNNYSVIY